MPTFLYKRTERRPLGAPFVGLSDYKRFEAPLSVARKKKFRLAGRAR